MKKIISIALVAFVALGATFASAQTGEVSTSVSVTGASTSVQTGAGIRATGTAQMSPEMRSQRAEMEMRAKALRQTQGATFGEKAMRASTTAAIKDMRGEYKENHAEMRIEMDARTKAMRASTTATHMMMKDGEQKKRFEQASKKAHAVVERLNAAIARVQKLSDRLSERLTKLEAEGVVTTSARAHLVEAKAKLSLATTQVASIKLSIETTRAAAATTTATTTVKTESKEAFKQVHEQVKEATKTIKEAHNHVALAISSVKPGQNKPRPATTTSVGATTTLSGSVNTQ